MFDHVVAAVVTRPFESMVPLIAPAPGTQQMASCPHCQVPLQIVMDEQMSCCAACGAVLSDCNMDMRAEYDGHQGSARPLENDLTPHRLRIPVDRTVMRPWAGDWHEDTGRPWIGGG